MVPTGVEHRLVSIGSSLSRLQRLLEQRDPAWSAPPGASEEDLGRLRRQVAPMLVPAEVETLYRWHDGLPLRILDTCAVQSIDELLQSRPFEIEKLHFAPSWLVISAPPGGTGSRVFATMVGPGEPPYGALWAAETHDQFASLLHSSLAAAVETFCDMLEDLPGGVPIDQASWRMDEALPRSPDDYRLARSPDAFTWPDPPPGTQTSNLPAIDWPAPWLQSLGTSAAALRARGGARPIAELPDRADLDAFPFTVQGTVDQRSSTDYRLTDDSGSVWVIDDGRTVLTPSMRERVEVDLTAEGGEYVQADVRVFPTGAS